MTLSLEAERALLDNRNFNRAQLDGAVTQNQNAFRMLPNQFSPGANQFNDAIRQLVGLRDSALQDGQLSDSERSSIRNAVSGVQKGRLAAERDNIPSDRLVQNEGEKGVYRDPGTGEIVRRDPGAQTLVEKAGNDNTVENEGEKGVHRDPGTGEIVRRDPGAQTLLEQQDANDRYAKSGKKVYREGPELNQVEAGARNFREGDKGPGVKQMQEMLKAAGYDVGTHGADGFFGPDTARAMQQFLDANNNPRGALGNGELARLQYLARGGK